MKTFASLDLIEPIQRALRDKAYVTPTPIQAQAIPPLLAGKDVLGCAQTGTGKTAAFLLPILQHLGTHPGQGKPVIRALILTPTRELAAQIGENLGEYSRHLDLYHHVIFGGVSQRPQVSALRQGVDVLVATPGRLLDLHEQGYIQFGDVEFFVLDEADRMLDMGFIKDIQRVIKMLPRQRQNLLFSATMPAPIVKLASAFLTDPVRVEVNPQSTTVERIEQHVMFVSRPDKKRLLVRLLEGPDVHSAIVFTRTKHGANRVARVLDKSGITAAAIHGNKSQGARRRALENFKSGDLRILVATDVASRGIDVDGVSHVINYDLPNMPESYVHRIGRTGRAGKGGVAIAFCDESETAYLEEIESLIKQTVQRDLNHPWHLQAAVPVPGKRATPPKRGGGQGRGRGGQRQGGRPSGGDGRGGPPRRRNRRRRR